MELSCPRTAHRRPLQTDNGRNVLPPVQSCTSNILKLCPSALPHHHQKMVGFRPKSYSVRPRLILSAVFLINCCHPRVISFHFRYPCRVLSYCLLWYSYSFAQDDLAPRCKNRQVGIKVSKQTIGQQTCSVLMWHHYWTLVNLQDLDQAVVCQYQGSSRNRIRYFCIF